MEIKQVTDPSFKNYGKIITGLEVADIVAAMQTLPLPEDTVYVAAEPALEALPVAAGLRDSGFGGIPIQIGYCNGHNDKLNALEYHRSSELNIAATDMILLLGHQTDVTDDHTYDTANVEGFLIPQGTVIEVYATTLHYAPCGVDGAGFRCVVVLPAGTNTDIDFKLGATPEDKLLTAKNKWLIAHEEAAIAGAFNGLRGRNIQL